MSLDLWSSNPANNDLAGYFQTGMRPSAVKTAGWDIMADLKQSKFSVPALGGTTAAATLAQTRTISAYFPGHELTALPLGASNGPMTLAIDSLAAEPVVTMGQPLNGNEMQLNVPALLKADAAGNYHLLNPAISNAENLFVDPCCQVAQRGININSAINSAANAYGAVDMVRALSSNNPTVGGTMQQETGGDISMAGTAARTAWRLDAVTFPANSKFWVKKYIESLDCATLVQASGFFRVKVYQDTGANVNFILSINKFNAVNSGGTTQIAAGSAVSVPSGVWTTLTLQAAMGACGNGVELWVECDCGATSLNNFYVTDFEAYAGGSIPPVCRVPRFDITLQRVMRYVETSYEYGTNVGSVTTNGRVIFDNLTGTGWLFYSFKVKKVGDPVATIYSPNSGASGKVYDRSAAADETVTSEAWQHLLNFTPTGGSAGDRMEMHFYADARF